MKFELYNDSYKSFCNLLRADASALEIDCGPCDITRPILDLNPKLKVLATDNSENMINLAKSNNPAAEVQILDCMNLKIIDTKFKFESINSERPIINKKKHNTL